MADHAKLAERFSGLSADRGGCRIAVTGGSGFIGTNVIDFYLANGVTEIVNWDIRPPRNPTHAHLWRQLDVTSLDALREQMVDFAPDHLFHLAARTDLTGKRLEEYAANTVGVRSVIETARALDARPRVIFASSRMVCRIGYQPESETDYCPPNAYGQSKVATEKIVREEAHDLEWVMVRPTSIWGPWFGVPYRDFFESIYRGRYVHPRGQKILKTFGFVGNTAYQLDKLMFQPARQTEHRTLYLGDYPPLEVFSWASQITDLVGKRHLRSAPVVALRAIARAGDLAERLGMRDAPLTSFRLDNLLTEMVYDTAELEAVTGPLPFSLEEGTAMTVEWLMHDLGEQPTREPAFASAGEQHSEGDES